MDEERLKNCPRCGRPLKSLQLQSRRFRFYDEDTSYLRCKQCGWESSVILRIDHFNAPEPEPTKERPHLRLIVPGEEEEDDVLVEKPSTASIVPPPRQRSRPRKTVSSWHWFAAAIVVVVPWAFVVLVYFKTSDGSPAVQAVVPTEPAVVAPPVVTPAPTPARSPEATPPHQAPGRPKRRHAPLPLEEDWPAPISFDCDRLQTASERLQCAGRPF
jgi:hypothetical protein